MDLRRAARRRLGGTGDGRQLLVVDRDLPAGFLGLGVSAGDHHRDMVAAVAPLVARPREVRPRLVRDPVAVGYRPSGVPRPDPSDTAAWREGVGRDVSI